MADGNQHGGKSGRWVGTSVPRPDARAKVTGELLYVDDLPFDGLYGATVRTRAPRGAITAIRFRDDGPNWDEFAIVSAKDIPRFGDDGIDPNLIDLIERDQPYLVRDEFRHVHEPVVLLAHPDRDTVRAAVEHIDIEYAAAPAQLDYTETPTAEVIQHGEDNCYKHILVSKGAADADDEGASFDALFSKASHVVEALYSTTAQEQCYIEPQGVIARVEVDESERTGEMWPTKPWKMIIEGSMQCPYYVHKAMTRLFQLPGDRVQVIASPLGGGFGGKEDYPSIIAGHAGLLALKTRRPVKIVYDRLEDMVATTKRHPSQTRVRAALDGDGKLVAIDMDVLMDGGAYLTLSPVVLSRGAIHAIGPYHIDHVRLTNRVVLSNTPPNGAFRGFGAPQTVFAFERHIDRCAKELGLDPAELRRRNLIVRGQSLAVSQTIDEPIELRRWMDEALEAMNYSERRSANEDFNLESRLIGGPLRRGIGLATFMHGAGFTGSGEDYLASKVKVRATAEGRVEVLTANTEMGQGSITVLTQMAADALGLDLEDIQIASNDTDQVPNSGPTVASRTSMVVGHLVARACDDLVGRIEGAGLLDEADRREPPCGPVSAISEGRGQYWRPDALRAALRAAADATDGEVGEGWSQYQRPPGGAWNDETYKGIAYGTYAWATYIAEVEVDLTTFEVTLLDFLASQEIGRVLNPVLATGQIEGGVVQGVGWALLEDTVMADGAMINGNMTNYVVPTSADVPPIQVMFHEQPYSYGPYGAKGIGELPMDGPAPAIVNAVSDAIDVQIDALPCSPERLMEAIIRKSAEEEATT